MLKDLKLKPGYYTQAGSRKIVKILDAVKEEDGLLYFKGELYSEDVGYFYEKRNYKVKRSTFNKWKRLSN